MAVLTIRQSNQISALINRANACKRDVRQNVFYKSKLVDVVATNSSRGDIVLNCGDLITWDEVDKEWC